MSTFAPVPEYLPARDVVLGRTTHVRRVLPSKSRRMIGAWCFLDHYGPDDVKQTGGMWVPPHPHTGLQTVTWLFEGLGLHTDSLGSQQLLRPGQLNVMTAGDGVCHAEVSPPDAPRMLHGVQLWVCLPEETRHGRPAFDHLPELPTYVEQGVTLRVLAGTLAGETSPAPAYTPLVGAEVRLRPGAHALIPLEPEFEHGVLVAAGEADVAGQRLGRDDAVYLDRGRLGLEVSAPSDAPGEAVLVLLGGEPFEEDVVMWWNFIGRSHDEVVAQREDWNGAGTGWVPPRFGEVSGFDGERLLAPPMPNVRLRARGRAS